MKAKRKWSVVSVQCSVKNKRKLTTHHLSLTTGFTLIELMVVIAIILLIVGIMIPNLTRQMERGREGKVKADMRVLINAINLFRVDQGRFPTNEEGLDVLLNPPDSNSSPYISDEVIPQTPWKGRYEYELKEGYYVIRAKDREGKVKYEKKVNF
ncbi:MAG TPA: prepilin-type N-terminal cleavage/methylation domain-containing protein [Candidatus Omnitrophica bacterium]|nr:prepilin-type N-terminal cleavage/methylation domain-containing protein [Candidatus Omnitrophota bacterium]